MSMSSRIVCMGLLMVAGSASAGEIYGTISQDGRPVAGREVSVTCESASPTTRATDSLGAYRVFVNSTGSCKLRLAGLPEVTVQSYSSAQRYNFEIVRGSEGSLVLQRR